LRDLGTAQFAPPLAIMLRRRNPPANRAVKKASRSRNRGRLEKTANSV
jgi:hypothetical protein